MSRLGRTTGIWLLLATAGTFLLFDMAPGLDMRFATWTHDSVAQHFRGGGDPTVALVRDLAEKLVRLTWILLLLAVLARIAWPDHKRAFSARPAVYALAVLLVGPWLLTNEALKNHWGRPRPREVVEFGGDQPFTPAGMITSRCDRNCSFVSGETAAAFWLLVPAALLRGRRRWLAIGVLLPVGIATAAARMLVGAHFLSDVVLAGLLTGLGGWLCYLVFFVCPRTARLAAGIDPALAALGRYGRARWPARTDRKTP